MATCAHKRLDFAISKLAFKSNERSQLALISATRQVPTT